MSDAENMTLTRIHEAAAKEFLEKGFQAASLRNIVKTAGVTTGAFYGYYKSKEALFSALVGDAYENLLSQYRTILTTFAELPIEQQRIGMKDYVAECLTKITGDIYRNLPAFKLILCCSEGTKYEHLVHDMAALDVAATNDFSDAMLLSGVNVQAVNPKLEHMLISGMFSAYFELFIHDIPQEESGEYIRQLMDFHMAGWQKIMGF